MHPHKLSSCTLVFFHREWTEEGSNCHIYMLNCTVNLHHLLLHDTVRCLCEFKIIVFFQRTALVSHKHVSGSERNTSSRTPAPHMQQNKACCQTHSAQDLSFCFIGGQYWWVRLKRKKAYLFPYCQKRKWNITER